VHAVLVAVANGRNLGGGKETQMTEPATTPPRSTIRVARIKSGYMWSVSIVADGDTDADVDEARELVCRVEEKLSDRYDRKQEP
jgi:hypothetical protein